MDGGIETRSASAHEAARRAEDSWIRVVSNRAINGYDVYEAASALGEPEWPEGVTFEMVLRIAFRERFITSLDHPILRKLRGEL